MYYRWTEKARPFISSYDGEVVGKWKRIKYSELLKKYPQYWQWVRQGDMEIKDESSTPKQIAQRKMWQLLGRTKALSSQMSVLAAELRANYPHEFGKYMSDELVIGHMWHAANSMDMGLVLKKYYPDLFREN